MQRILTLGLGLGLLAGVLTGCGEEDPSSLAADILDESFRTFSVVFEAGDFLQADTTYDRLGTIQAAPFALVADSFGGELQAHTLFRVNRPPSRITYENEGGVDVRDSLYTVVGGTLTLVLDSLRDSRTPVDLDLYELTESWDAATVTWDVRADTGDAALPWTQPGGTTGQLLGSTTTESGDTVRIALDSATAAVWMDSAAAARGGLVRSTTPDSRLRIQSMEFAFDVRPSEADTLLTSGSIGVETFVVTPGASTPDSTELRVGGVPTWRSAVRFRPLADLPIPCGPEATTCTLPLSEVEVNLATLLLTPVPVGPRRIERPLRVEGRAILQAPGVPLNRAALTNALGRMVDPVPPAAFTVDPAEPTVAAVPITGYIRRNVNPAEGEDPILWLALLAESERAAPVFGYAAFGSHVSAAPPRLQLVVTVPVEEEGQ